MSTLITRILELLYFHDSVYNLNLPIITVVFLIN